MVVGRKVHLTCLKEIVHEDGRVERLLSDGVKVTMFPSGSVKETNPDGHVTVHLVNGDVKEVHQRRRRLPYADLVDFHR